MLTMSKYINITATTVGTPARATISAGKNVQYPNKKRTAQINTDGTHALVRIETISPR